MRDRDPLHLHPLVRKLHAEHLRLAEGEPRLRGRVRTEETWRPLELQAGDWRKGRGPNGEIIDAKAVVTDARPGASWHNLERWERDATGTWQRVPSSFAYHLALVDDGDELPGSWEGFGSNQLGLEDIGDFTLLGEIGESLGLTWGGRWRKRDYLHHELRPGPLSHVIAALNIQGGDLAGVGGLST
jgi:hypothetical protein